MQSKNIKHADMQHFYSREPEINPSFSSVREVERERWKKRRVEEYEVALGSREKDGLNSVNVTNILAAVVSPPLGLIACVRQDTLC